MKKPRFERGAKIPSYALSYLVNNDPSGLLPEDRATIDTWMEENHIFAIHPDFEESFFTWNPEFGLACDVQECTIEYRD